MKRFGRQDLIANIVLVEEFDAAKLLVARATLRVFLFCPTSTEDAEAILERVAAAIRDFRDRDPKDAYLLCAITAAAPRCVLFKGSGEIHPLPLNKP